MQVVLDDNGTTKIQSEKIENINSYRKSSITDLTDSGSSKVQDTSQPTKAMRDV